MPPPAWMRSACSAASVVFPMPGSPDSTTTRGSPASAAVHAPSRAMVPTRPTTGWAAARCAHPGLAAPASSTGPRRRPRRVGAGRRARRPRWSRRPARARGQCVGDHDRGRRRDDDAGLVDRGGAAARARRARGPDPSDVRRRARPRRSPARRGVRAAGSRSPAGRPRPGSNPPLVGATLFPSFTFFRFTILSRCRGATGRAGLGLRPRRLGADPVELHVEDRVRPVVEDDRRRRRVPRGLRPQRLERVQRAAVGLQAITWRSGRRPRPRWRPAGPGRSPRR